jgi:hypothetical protein
MPLGFTRTCLFKPDRADHLAIRENVEAIDRQAGGRPQRIGDIYGIA